MSGAKAQRPGLDALMADSRLHKFDAVIVWKLDRFGRSLINCVAGIQELTAAGVRLIAGARHGRRQSHLASAPAHPRRRGRV
jgi:DNA invertase Pin-like site-specific DNA recombinase